MVYPISRFTLQPLFRAFIGNVEGKENIPADKGFIIAANHSSFLDDVALPCIIIPQIDKKVHFYVNRDYCRSFLLRSFLRYGATIPVAVDKKLDAKQFNQRAFEKALYYLSIKEPVGIFPEGHRSPDGNLLRAKTGIAKLALAAKVPVLPIGIIGSHKVFPKGAKLPKPGKFDIKIGELMYFDEYHGRDDRETLINVTRKIMKNIAKLIGKEYNY